MKIVTGHTGTDHVTSNDMQAFNQGVFGNGNYVLNIGTKFSAALVDSTHVSLSAGEGVMQGVHFRIERGQTETVTLDSGEIGKNRIDVICARYTKNTTTGVESVSAAVVKGTAVSGAPVMPDVTTGDILGGDSPVDFPLYSVRLNGVSPETPEALFPVVGGSSEAGADIASIGADVTALQNLMTGKSQIKFNEFGVISGSLSSGTDEIIDEYFAIDLQAGHKYFFLFSGDYQTTPTIQAGTDIMQVKVTKYDLSEYWEYFTVTSVGAGNPVSLFFMIPVTGLQDDRENITVSAQLMQGQNVSVNLVVYLIEIVGN